MKRPNSLTCLFVDIGGVLLTNGWDHTARKRAAKKFDLDYAEMEDRHARTFDTYEEGKITLDEYLRRVVFHQPRPFTRAEFRRLMFAQSKPYPRMIELVINIRKQHGLKVVVVNNEGRELNEHRIRTFKLDSFADVIISSCYVHVRKPDADIFHLALDIAHVRTREVVFIENTPMFVQVAEGLGIRSILHTDPESTRERLGKLGLEA
jgi:putative hydrolase of the HAD superfamily